MKLVFKEATVEELNSHDTNSWTGVGINAGVVGGAGTLAGVLILT